MIDILIAILQLIGVLTVISVCLIIVLLIAYGIISLIASFII